jgi:hypothetical protein
MAARAATTTVSWENIGMGNKSKEMKKDWERSAGAGKKVEEAALGER